MAKASRWRRIAAYVLAIPVGLIFVVMGVMKLDPDGFWTAAFEAWGYPVWFRYAIGVLETLGGAALLVPRLASYAASLLTIIMAGAFVTRLGDGLSGDHVAILVYAGLLVWFTSEWWDRRWQSGQARGVANTR